MILDQCATVHAAPGTISDNIDLIQVQVSSSDTCAMLIKHNRHRLDAFAIRMMPRSKLKLRAENKVLGAAVLLHPL